MLKGRNALLKIPLRRKKNKKGKKPGSWRKHSARQRPGERRARHPISPPCVSPQGGRLVCAMFAAVRHEMNLEIAGSNAGSCLIRQGDSRTTVRRRRDRVLRWFLCSRRSGFLQERNWQRLLLQLQRFSGIKGEANKS